MPGRLSLRIAIFLFAAIACVSAGYAQNAVSTGTLSGTIHDAGGASIANVKIEVTSETTGVKQASTTNTDGIFSFPALPVGTYNARFSLTGFKETTIKDLSVGVGRTTDASATLVVGDVSQTVEVEAASTDLNPTDTSTGTLLEKATVENLPLAGRRYTDFVLLTPNVTTDGEFGHITFAGQPGGQLSGYNNTAGGASNNNGSSAFTVDGANATSYFYGDNRGFTRIPYIFGLQSIEEFQVQSGVYNSAYGGAGAGFINTVTKSGSNVWHGDAFYNNANSGTGANDAIDKAAGNPKLADIMQQFGADAGGPIKKDKLFFYFDYEQQRNRYPLYARNAGQASTTIQSFAPAGYTYAPGTTLPSPNSRYPAASSLSESDVAEDPTNPVYLQGVANALAEIHSNLGPRARRRDDLEFFPKLDWQATSKDHLTMLYNYNTFNAPGGIITFSPEAFAGDEALGNNFVRDHSAGVHWTRVLSPIAVNDVHVSFSRDEQFSGPSGLAPAAAPDILVVSPQFFILGNGFGKDDFREYQYEFSDHLTYTLGKHTLEAGFDFDHDTDSDGNYGSFIFPTYLFTSLEDFALAKWDIYTQNSGNPKYKFSDPFYGFYVNDTFRLASNLTITAGVREDFQVFPNPTGNPTLPFTAKFQNHYNRWSPRLGFSWQAIPKTVVRGGIGLYYEYFEGSNYQASTQTNGVASQDASLSFDDFSSTSSATTQPVVFPNSLPSNDALFAAGTNIVTIAPNFKIPSVINSSLQIDREIANHTVVTVGSMWSHGVHLTASTAYDMNQLPPTGTTTYVLPSGGTVTGPNLDSGLIQHGLISSSLNQINALFSPGVNNYISLFAQLNRQVAHGLTSVVSYTLSKSTQSGVDFTNQFDLAHSRGLSLLDERNHLAVALIYKPTVSFANHTATTLLENWETSLLSQVYSGRPYTAVIGNAPSGHYLNDSAALQGTPNTAAGLVGGGNQEGLAPGEGMNSFTGPGIEETDFGLLRNFKIGDRQVFTLKVRVFNLFNSANYYVEAGSGINQIEYTASGATCGDGVTLNQTCVLTRNTTSTANPAGFQSLSLVSQGNPPRIVQFAFNYSF